MGEALIGALPFHDAARTLSAAPDLRVGFFTLALAVVTGVGFGLVPALRASQADLAPSLKSEATAVVGGSGHFRLRKGLVVARVALSLLLLIGAGLFARRLMNLRSLDPGFKPDRLFAFDVDPARSGQDFPQRVATLRRIQEELVGEPGVASASAAGVSRSVLLLVLREVAILAGLGIAIGLPGGYGLGKVIESQLYNLKARDPLTYLVATLALVTTALVVGLIPALRAARVDPMTALRYEQQLVPERSPCGAETQLVPKRVERLALTRRRLHAAAQACAPACQALLFVRRARSSTA